ncbi:MAG: 3-carboxy-cis,cis-muconate cycloisomerase [Rhodospirillales bacterium]|nr:3-carboxy-cis,cis-muconate cycloisomerase [Rhodospirillales bacterium]
MPASPLDSAIYGALFSDEQTAALFSDTAEVRAMLEVEAALARVQGRLGVIPSAAGAEISEALKTAAIDPGALAAGTAGAGVPVPALLALLRRAVGGEAAQYLHWGATSQDVLDTALVLRLRDALEIFEQRLVALAARLAELSAAHRATLMAGRTRSQQATPTSFGLKLAGWLAPLLRHRRRLEELRPRVLAVQFGGAVGSLAALGEAGVEVMEGLAAELGLTAPVLPWHAQRDGLAELAGWLSLVTGSLGKIGQDVVLLAQSEVGELRAGAEEGGSSTMPQKANPVAGEALVAIARMNAALLSNSHQALIHEQERGGAAWQQEWLGLPQMAILTGAALRHAGAMAARLEVRPEVMRANLEASNGLVLAEAASFALAAHMPRPEAQALVKATCREIAGTGRHLIDALREKSDAPLDWDALRDPANYLGVADALIDRVLHAARAKPSAS